MPAETGSKGIIYVEFSSRDCIFEYPYTYSSHPTIFKLPRHTPLPYLCIPSQQLLLAPPVISLHILHAILPDPYTPHRNS